MRSERDDKLNGSAGNTSSTPGGVGSAGPAGASNGAGVGVGNGSGGSDNMEHPPEAVVVLTRPVSLIDRSWELFDRLWTWLGQDAMPRMAAALTYRTIFSLVPLLLIGFLVLRLFTPAGSQEDFVKSQIGALFDQIGLSALQTTDAAGKTINLEAFIGDRVGSLVKEGAGINFGVVGLVSALVLIYAALSLLLDIESSFNHIYGASRGRSWTKRILQYWFIVSVGPLLMFGSFGAGQAFNSWAGKFITRVGESSILQRATSPAAPAAEGAGPNGAPGATGGATGTAPAAGQAGVQAGEGGLAVPPASAAAPTAAVGGDQSTPSELPTTPAATVVPITERTWTSIAIEFVGYSVRVGISTLLLWTLYLFIPNTIVRVRPALVGALLAAIGIEIAKFAFFKFFSTKGYQTLYGGLALLPLFLLWVYIIWFIVLFGLRVSFLVQHGKGGILLNALRSSTKSGLSGAWIEPSRAVSVAVAIAEAFQRGGVAHADRLAESAGMDEPTLRLLMNRLEEGRIVHRVMDESRYEAWTLSRPAELIQVAELVEVGQVLAGPVEPGTGGELILKIRKAQVDAVAGLSLASLVTTPKPIRVARAGSAALTNFAGSVTSAVGSAVTGTVAGGATLAGQTITALSGNGKAEGAGTIATDATISPTEPPPSGAPPRA